MTLSTLILVADTPDAAGFLGDFLRSRFPADKVSINVQDTPGLLTVLENCSAQEVPKVVLMLAASSDKRITDDLQRIRAQPRGRLVPLVLVLTDTASLDPGVAARCGANSCIRLAPDDEHRSHDLDQLVRYWIDLNIPPPCVTAQA